MRFEVGLILSIRFALSRCSDTTTNEPSSIEDKCAPVFYSNTYYYGELIAIVKNVFTISECIERCKDDELCASVNHCNDAVFKCELLKDNLHQDEINDTNTVASVENCVLVNNIKCNKQRLERATKIRAANATAGTCGLSVFQPRRSLQRIVGGFESKPHSFPWIASLTQRNTHYCGGSLISVGHNSKSDIIVTAAHCLIGVKPNMLSVKLGCTDIAQKNCITIAADKFDAHTKFNFDSGINDIALIRLQKPVSFTGVVMPICLPSASDRPPLAGTVCIAAGWGSTFENGPGTSRLRQVEVPVIDINVCNNQNFYKGQLDAKAMLCAGYAEGKKDSCQGDSGGPLMMKRGKEYVLVGVVSFGEGCARPNFPGIYSNVYHYKAWLDQRIKLLSAVSRQIL